MPGELCPWCEGTGKSFKVIPREQPEFLQFDGQRVPIVGVALTQLCRRCGGQGTVKATATEEA